MIEYSLICGIIAFYITRLIRIVKPFSDYTKRGIKPFSCNVCMSFWCSSIVAICLAICCNTELWSFAAAPGVSLLLLDYYSSSVNIEVPHG